MAKTTAVIKEVGICSICGMTAECVQIKTRWLFTRTVRICQACVSKLFKQFDKTK